MFNKEVYNVVVYGDSITKGVVFDEQRERYVVLKDNFSNLVKNDFKGVIQAVGKFGNTILAGAEKLHHHVIKKNPDIVLLEFGGNDCDFEWDEIARDPVKDHQPKTDLELFKGKLKDTIQILREHNVVPVLMSLPPLDAEKYFKWISKNDPNQAKNILVWLETVSKIYWWHERYNSAIMHIAAETDTRLIDVRGAFLEEADYRNLISIDGIHPNEQGHQVIARRIIQYVQEKYDFLMKR